jgi:hypothetical protein
MKASDQSISDLYKTKYVGNLSAADSARMQDIDDVKNQAVDQALWASAQGNALAKLKIFHTMAKSINDQQ